MTPQNFGRYLSTLASILFFAFGVSPVLAQEAQPKRGFQTAAAYALSDIETINTTNGNLLLNIPLGALPPGRSGLSGNLSLAYNSKLYETRIEEVLDSSNNITSQNLLRSNLDSGNGGWHYAYDYRLKIVNRNNEEGGPYQCILGQPYESQRSVYIWKIQVVFPDGGAREFRPTGYQDYFGDGYFNVSTLGEIRYASSSASSCTITIGQDPNPAMTYYSSDGSYTKLTIQRNGDWALSFLDGSRLTNFSGQAQRMYDRNNNYLSFQNIILANGSPARSIIDQFGRPVSIEFTATDDLIHTWGNDGVEKITTIKWKTIHAERNYKTTAATSGRMRGGISTQLLRANFRVVDQIILPAQGGGLTYTFGYNTGTAIPSNGWGEVSSVTLPTGAQVSYSYAFDIQPSPLPTCRDILDNSPITKTLNYQNTYDGQTVAAAPEVWNYNIDSAGSTVVTPDGGITFQEHGDTSTHNQYSGLLLKSATPDGKVVENYWRFNYPAGVTGNANINAYIKTQFTSLKNAAGSLTKTAIKDFSYDLNGNLTQTVDYDWVNYSDVPRDVGLRPTGVIPGSAVAKRVVANTFVATTPYEQPASAPLRNAQSATEIRPGLGQNPVARTEYTYDNALTTGNVTLTRQWDSTKGALSIPLSDSNSIKTQNQYSSWPSGETGRLDVTIDANGNYSRFTYGDVGVGITSLYPTTTIVGDNVAANSPVKLTTTRKYEFYTGFVKEATDVDNNLTTKTTYDVFGRPTLVQEAFGTVKERRTVTEYSDAARRVITRADQDATGDGKLISIQHYDQLGRLRLSRTLESANYAEATDETKGIKVQTRYAYSNPNSYELTSAPYRAATSDMATENDMGWKRSKFDNGGRLLEVETFGVFLVNINGVNKGVLPAPWSTNTASNGKVTTSYDAEFTAVTDQTNRARRSMVDGLGRLCRVDEPDKTTGSLGSTGAPVQPTNYNYNVLGNLTQSTQTGLPLGGSTAVTQTRTFGYSSLGRLITANNPENGTNTYTYDNNGNLTSKTDARGVTATMAYDQLNRHTSTGYNDGVTPVLQRGYDGATRGKGKPWYTVVYGLHPITGQNA